MEKISIIVPCYNEAQTVPIFYKEITEVFKKMDYELELLFVDDGSRDKTLLTIKELTSDKCVKYLSFSRNFGKEAAILAGFDYLVGDYVGLMDADFQYPASLFPEM